MLILRYIRTLVQEQGPDKDRFIHTWRVCISNLITIILLH